MHEKALKRFREQVRARDYVMTLHAEEEMNEDGYTIYDVESGILTGVVHERQRDRTTGESKYRIRGKTASRVDIELVAKLSPSGKMVVITVYAP